MKNLKKLGLSFALISVLALTAFAGETPTGPCAPGQTDTPPCAMAQATDDSVAPGETPTPPASTAGDEYSLADAAVDLLQSVLLIF